MQRHRRRRGLDRLAHCLSNRPLYDTLRALTDTGTKYDRAARKRARRSGRERGVHIYIPAEVIGHLADVEHLFYTLAGGARGRVVVTLHREP